MWSSCLMVWLLPGRKPIKSEIKITSKRVIKFLQGDCNCFQFWNKSVNNTPKKPNKAPEAPQTRCKCFWKRNSYTLLDKFFLAVVYIFDLAQRWRTCAVCTFMPLVIAMLVSSIAIFYFQVNTTNWCPNCSYINCIPALSSLNWCTTPT